MRIVVKIGGSVLGTRTQDRWLEEIIQLAREGHQLLIVHGAGSLITDALARRQAQTVFIDGQRVTTPEVMEDVIREMRGTANLEVVSLCRRVGLSAVGLSGADGGFFDAAPLSLSQQLGLVGQVGTVHSALVTALWDLAMIPVVAPLAPAVGSGKILNINGDWAASGLAQQLDADVLLYYTDTGGVRMDADDAATLLTNLAESKADALIAAGRISRGMIPKVRAALAASNKGVGWVGIGSWYHPEMTTQVVGGKEM